MEFIENEQAKETVQTEILPAQEEIKEEVKKEEKKPLFPLPIEKFEDNRLYVHTT